MKNNDMMAHLLKSLEEGKDIGHYGRLTVVMVGYKFLSEDELVELLTQDPDCDEEKARSLIQQVVDRGYNPPKRERILDWMKKQEFPICPHPDDAQACNVYRDVEFPKQVYDRYTLTTKRRMDKEQKQIRWGVLGAARIATVKVIPAMQKGTLSRVVAIASRELARAQAAADEIGIARAYGSYEELLEDPEIDAVYNPLPNHLHVPWSVKAAAAGKHVLCEKPVSITAAECRELIAARDQYGVKIGEAFMVRSHPQWLRACELVRVGELGALRSVVTAFNYHKLDRSNIRNVKEYGGGGLMDIGCYAIHIARWLFGEEPAEVRSAVEFNAAMGIDRLTSAVLRFPSGHSVFTCGTQQFAYQNVQLLCERGRVELAIPFNAPPGETTRILVSTDRGTRTEEFAPCDQYTLQGEDFSRAILEDTEVPVPLEDALRNMEVIDRVFEGG